jgi:hypothetical protein
MTLTAQSGFTPFCSLKARTGKSPLAGDEDEVAEDFGSLRRLIEARRKPKHPQRTS